MTTDERIDKIKDELANTLAEISSLDTKLTAMTTKVNELQTELAETKKQADDEKFPKRGDIYYSIDIDCDVASNTWYEDEWDCGRMSFGNVFKTREEAERVVEFFKAKHEKLAVLIELSEFAEPDDTPWGDRRHWYLRCNSGTCGLVCDWTDGQFMTKRCMIYFASKEDAEKAVQTVGEDRIKKYLFGYKGVEE